MILRMVWLVVLLGVSVMPAQGHQAADVLMAIEAARHAATESQRQTAALELETLAFEGAPGAAAALATLIMEEVVDGAELSARTWARSAHEAGEADATLLLARMYATGYGGDADSACAADLAREAAQSGVPAAGVLVYELLLDTDMAGLAMGYLMRSAESGYPPAMQLIGTHLAAGEHIERDDTEAYFWLMLAAAHGLDRSVELAAAVGRHLGVEERRGILAAALAWRPQ